MAALTLPLGTQDLVDLMMVETITWTLAEYQELSGDGAGEWLAADLGPRLWEAACSSCEADLETIEALRARFHVLDGAINSFYLYDPARPNPATDPAGALLASASVTIGSIEDDRKRLTLIGLPAGFVLPISTRLSVTAGSPSRTAYLQLAASVTTNGAGVAGPVELRPHLRPWIVAGQPVKLLKPVAKVKIMPKSLSVVQLTPVTHRLRFTCRQTLSAG